MTGVDLEGIVELAVVLGHPFVPGVSRVFTMRRRLGIEVTLAEHRAATGLDDGGVHRPIRCRLLIHRAKMSRQNKYRRENSRADQTLPHRILLSKEPLR